MLIDSECQADTETIRKSNWTPVVFFPDSLYIRKPPFVKQTAPLSRGCCALWGTETCSEWSLRLPIKQILYWHIRGELGIRYFFVFNHIGVACSLELFVSLYHCKDSTDTFAAFHLTSIYSSQQSTGVAGFKRRLNKSWQNGDASRMALRYLIVIGLHMRYDI